MSPKPNQSCSTRKWLPPMIAEVADRVGVEAALRLVAEFGGQEINVPIRPRKGQVLVERVGMDVARALAEMRGGEKLAIPNGAKRFSKRYAILAAKGSVHDIVKQTGSTARWVRKVKNDARNWGAPRSNPNARRP